MTDQKRLTAESGNHTERNTLVLSDQFLLLERANDIGGVQRIYRFPCGAGLSFINATMAHSYPFAWEAAVLSGVKDNGGHDGLDYSTPLTSGVEVFDTVEEANAFIQLAAGYFAGRSKVHSVAESPS